MIVGLAVVGFLIVVGIGLAAAQSFHVVAEGQLLPYTEGKIYEVETLGMRVFLEPEVRPSLDVMVSAMLLAVSSMAALTLVVFRNNRRGEPSRRRFYGLVMAGAGFLAADELFGIHETIGHNLQFLMDLPGIDRPDDAVVLGYVIVAAVFVWLNRRQLLTSRRALTMWMVATVIFAVAAVGDTVGLRGEELIELVAALFIVGGFASLAAEDLRVALT